MKKALTSIAIFALSSVMALADGPKNHISIAASESLPITLAASVADAFIAIGSIPSDQEAAFIPCGSYTLGYSRDLRNNRFRLGGDVVYAPLPYNVVDKETGEKISTDSSTGIMLLMFTGRYNYIQKEHFQFYGKAAIGASANTEFSTISYAFQIDPVAIRFGGPKFAGFLEAGIGLRGFLNLGVEYSF